jgi:TPR repeat protein
MDQAIGVFKSNMFLLLKFLKFFYLLRWFSLAAEEGCPKASNRLGLLYFHGKGTYRYTLYSERSA